jgi:hypothetical protein
VAGLLRPRPSLKQIEQAQSNVKFRERKNGNYIYFSNRDQLTPKNLQKGDRVAN